MKANYHTHMHLCRHASGNVEDYVHSAIINGLQILGMSDHAPFEELKDRSIRMYPEELPIYIRECDEAIEKYKDKIKIYKGLEIEYFDDHKEKYEDLLQKMDYLILGQHYIPVTSRPTSFKSIYKFSEVSDLNIYADTLIQGMATGYFKMVCHPDLVFYGFRVFDENARRISARIIDAAIQYNLPLEINTNGIRRGIFQSPNGPRYIYPRLEFWKMVKEKKAKVVISSDAHDPDFLFDDMVIQAYKFAADLGIEVAEELDFSKHL